MDLLVGDVLVVLGGDEEGVHALRDHGAALLLVLHRHLRLAVRPQPRHCAVLAHLRQPVAAQQLNERELDERRQKEPEEARAALCS